MDIDAIRRTIEADMEPVSVATLRDWIYDYWLRELAGTSLDEVREELASEAQAFLSDR